MQIRAGVLAGLISSFQEISKTLSEPEAGVSPFPAHEAHTDDRRLFLGAISTVLSVSAPRLEVATQLIESQRHFSTRG